MAKENSPRLGHLSILECYHLAVALTARKFPDQAAREATIDAMEDLGMADEIFQFCIRGAVKSPVQAPDDAAEAMANKDIKRIDEINIEMEGKSRAADAALKVIRVKETTIDAVLAAIDKIETDNPTHSLMLAKVGRRFRAMKAGTYATPAELVSAE